MGYKHFSHRDDLVICSRADFQRAQCAVCNDECTGLTYGCKEHGFYIHYSCLLPQEISHPTHPTHSLFLEPVCTAFTCSACHSQRSGFRFLCRELRCCFIIDVKCAFPLPAVAYPGHDHRLYFFDELPEDAEHRQCKACSEPCRSLVLCCLDLNCKFGVHLMCERPLCLFEHPVSGELPLLLCRSKKFLEFKASIDEVNVDGRLCCYCSKEMGPQTPLYYCDYCKSIAHVKCIFSRADRDEDLTMIRAETKQDGSREGNSETNEAAMQHVETFGKMVNSLNPKEESELEDVYKRRVVEIIRVLAWRNNAGGSSSGRVQNWPFLDEAFLEFSKRLPHDIRRINSLAVASEEERLVQVAEYKMTKKLAPVLKKLFAIYGDLSEESNLTPKPKILVFVMLCGTIYSMDNTKVADVTEELLYNWWKYLMFIHLSRFNIQFAIDRLKVVMGAYYDYYTNLHDDNNSHLRMAVEMKELNEEIEIARNKLNILTEIRGRVLGATDENLVEACSKNAGAWKY